LENQPTLKTKRGIVPRNLLKVLLASPEKALLDFWYSMEGEWSLAQFPERKRSGIVYCG
jgi:hypothetical protein